ncbi:MAG: hypothetical protein UV82_C0007G0012 [Candidatus Magasanikbacteria bacterium GW2011_GWD2_43_18]|nr:MAG: hypothetical protein UV18_C0009G0018 [Candidatus Magasanikbacteria bacterium GW2011_GWC2_42_27]KKT04512.1 MAG: hypothetical protein UV82_C0007G0012 [Candidatus Magasanikbacteria bacterium GW2011_GWD2_43_18]KKT25610.1 MAG: hypothetical protein UW10_C0006G0076 [Candidatus Magasanikbacteria bacterium GW2011_GWA2_43_9]HCM54271.1 hypothetical protein [Candidatus Magasanikbacteria bacterium]
MKYDHATIRNHVIATLKRCPSPEYAAQQLGRLAREKFPFHVVFLEKPSTSYSDDNNTRRARFVLGHSHEDTDPIRIDETVNMT